MSLLDAFLRDAWQQPVVRSDVFIAIRTDGATGSGTEYDPYNGKGYVGEVPTNATRFDSILSDATKVPASTTVHLGPTSSGSEFLTRGFIVNTFTGWTPRNGVRLVGAGVNATTIKVVHPSTPPPNTLLVAIGNNHKTDFLQGFEASDFTVDCAMTGTPSGNLAVGAVALTGQHVLLRRIRVIAFGIGGSGAPTCLGISTGRTHNENGNVPFDCVIDSCILESPFVGSGATKPIICLHLGSIMDASNWPANKWHQACVIRNCYVDGGASGLTNDIRGIAVFGGVGSVVECNRVLNCRYGGPVRAASDSSDSGDPSDSQLPVKELIVCDNYFYNVIVGLCQRMPGAGSDTNNVNARFLAHDNEIELALAGVSAEPNPTGMIFTGSSSTAPRRFGTLIVQGNAIRPKDNDTTTQATRYGIQFDSCSEALVEDNVINLGATSGGENPPDNAVRHDTSVAKLKVFNNEKSSGDFLPVFNSVTGLHDWELTNEAEDAFLVR